MSGASRSQAPSGGEQAPRAGDVLAGKYRVTRVLGEGGVGVVLAARDVVLDRRVAVKLLRREAALSADGVPRLLREARAAARIRSEHAVRVLDVAMNDRGLPFIVMEHLEGQDLESVLGERGPLPVADVCDYVLQAMCAVAEAHAGGMVHRDLKPSNLFLARAAGGGSLIKVLDFGLAKSTMPSADVKLTDTGAVLGSPVYMSPEQVRGERDLDARSDIWSLGVVLYELLTGCLPFEAATMGGVFAAILEQSPRPPSAVRAKLPPELDAIVLRCLARRREQRFADVLALGHALLPLAPREAGAARVAAIARALANPILLDEDTLPLSDEASARFAETLVRERRRERSRATGPEPLASSATTRTASGKPGLGPMSVVAVAAVALALTLVARVMRAPALESAGPPVAAATGAPGSAATTASTATATTTTATTATTTTATATAPPAAAGEVDRGWATAADAAVPAAAPATVAAGRPPRGASPAPQRGAPSTRPVAPPATTPAPAPAPASSATPPRPVAPAPPAVLTSGSRL